MSTQIQNADLNQYHEIGSYGVAEIMAMKDTIGKDLSIPQFNLFIHDSVRLGLEPRLKHSFPILYGGKMDFRISFEGFHAMAQRSEGYLGLKMEVVCDNETDDFFAETDEDGDITKVHHKIKFPRGKVVGSYAIAKREGKKNLIVFCDKSEFEKYSKKNAQFWKLDDGSLDPDMCKKHAGTRAIKGQFAVAAVADESTDSMYDSVPTPSVERRDITAEASHSDSPQPTPLKQQHEEPKVDPIEKANKDMQERFTQLGITEKEDKFKFFHDNGVKMKDWKKPTLAELQGVVMLLEQKIAEKQAAEEEPIHLEE